MTSNGGFAQYVVNHINTVHAIPEHIDFSEASMITNLGCVLYGFETIGGYVAGDHVAVIGPGPLGLISSQVAKAFGAHRVYLIGTRAARLAVGAETGADRIINVHEEDPVETVVIFSKMAVEECWGGRPAAPGEIVPPLSLHGELKDAVFLSQLSVKGPSMPASKETKQTKKIKEKVMFQPRLVWDGLSAREQKEVFSFAEEYEEFLSKAKTEREAVLEIEKRARKSGFKALDAASQREKCYKVLKNKAICLAVPGKRPLQEGIKLLIAHVDAPRLDLKQNPLYEEVDLALFKTHYYGGIKKYQWVSCPLALHGKIIRKDGSELDLAIGESESDPVFTIADLLPHLAQKAQYEKKLNEAVAGEKLNALVGSIPYPDRQAQVPKTACSDWY